MPASYLLVLVFILLLILLVSIIFTRRYRAWIYRIFSAVFALVLIFISFLAIGISHDSDPFEIETINYSSKKGYLYFFEGKGCSAAVRYGYPVNANEESWLEVGGDVEDMGTVILLAENDSIYQVPSPDYEEARLEIWEKELKKADECYRAEIRSFRKEQIYFSIAIGLLLFGLLFLFAYRRKFKAGLRKGVAS